MTSTGFDVRKIGGRIGAEVLGVTLSDELGPALFTDINAALLEHKALIFRGRHLDDAAQLRFASLFGELTTAHPTVPSPDGQPSILPVDPEEGIRANRWHTDVTFVRTPPRVSTLRGIVVPPYGGNTLIANAAAAYRDLPEPLRHLADSLWAVPHQRVRLRRAPPGARGRPIHTGRRLTVQRPPRGRPVCVHRTPGDRPWQSGAMGRPVETPELRAFLESLRRGEPLSGTVAAIERFGVFVALDDGPDHPVLPGVGFITIPELTWLRVASAAEVGQRLSGRVTKLVPFGVFVWVADGIEGLVGHGEHTGPQATVRPGDEATVTVTDVDREHRRLALSRLRARSGAPSDVPPRTADHGQLRNGPATS
ncbi:TauD/TfdA family dioxygenase [Streptomyces cucumeris]|uniref:TauD/TfdA dioxygenase family protein n=1 Tax=Streptomyces cucumeris TaxID=2962890 RepID=UPI003D71E246